MFEILNTIALFVAGISIAHFVRVTEALRRADQKNVDDIRAVQLDVTSLKEWRLLHEKRQEEVIATIKELDTYVRKRFEDVEALIRSFIERVAQGRA